MLGFDCLGLTTALTPTASACSLSAGALRIRTFLFATAFSFNPPKISQKLWWVNQKAYFNSRPIKSILADTNSFGNMYFREGSPSGRFIKDHGSSFHVYMGWMRGLWTRISFCRVLAPGTNSSSARQKLRLWFKCRVWTSSCKMT